MLRAAAKPLGRYTDVGLRHISISPRGAIYIYIYQPQRGYIYVIYLSAPEGLYISISTSPRGAIYMSYIYQPQRGYIYLYLSAPEGAIYMSYIYQPQRGYIYLSAPEGRVCRHRQRFVKNKNHRACQTASSAHVMLPLVLIGYSPTSRVASELRVN
jgi:hypothetical protein